MPAGSPAYWFADLRVVQCSDCWERASNDPVDIGAALPGEAAGESVVPRATPPSAAESARPLEGVDGAALLAVPAEQIGLSRQLVGADLGGSVDDDSSSPPPGNVAGGSAQREYDRRSAKEQERKKKAVEDDVARRAARVQQRPNVLTPRVTIGPESQATKAWKVGAEGERRIAEVLADVKGIAVLHDRLVPGQGAANLDHVLVTPKGVFIVDAKKYSGTLECRVVGKGFSTDLRLYVAGRDRSKLIDAMGSQVEVVRGVLAPGFEHIPVRGILCFVGCEWTRKKVKNVRDIAIVWPTGLPELVSGSGPFEADAVAVAELLAKRLRPARAS
jgi:hypothetical protein